MKLPLIGDRPGEPDMERARHRRLRPTRIGGGMAAMIAPQNTPAAQAAQADKEARQARWDEVQKVIKAGGGPAKCCERFFPVPDQTVGGVDGLISPYAGKAADEQPEKRRNDAVAEAFREAFYSGARNACFIQRGGVAADDVADGAAGGEEIASLQRLHHGQDMIEQAALRESRPGRKREPHPGPGPEQLTKKAIGTPGDRDGDRQEDQQREDATCPAARGAEAGVVEAAFAGGDDPGEGADRMSDARVQPGWPAENCVEEERGQLNQGLRPAGPDRHRRQAGRSAASGDNLRTDG